MKRDIYIVLSNSGTLPGTVIQKLTHFSYCHAMLALTADCRELYSFGRRSLHNFLNGGFVIERRDGRFFTYFSETRCRILALAVTEEQYAALRRELSIFRDNAREYKYDFIGCCLRYFQLKKTFDRRYTCSHFVAEILQRSGICRFPKGTMLVRPGDFMDVPGVRVVYEGRLAELATKVQEGECAG